MTHGLHEYTVRSQISVIVYYPDAHAAEVACLFNTAADYLPLPAAHWRVFEKKNLPHGENSSDCLCQEYVPLTLPRSRNCSAMFFQTSDGVSSQIDRTQLSRPLATVCPTISEVSVWLSHSVVDKKVLTPFPYEDACWIRVRKYQLIPFF